MSLLEISKNLLHYQGSSGDKYAVRITSVIREEQ